MTTHPLKTGTIISFNRFGLCWLLLGNHSCQWKKETHKCKVNSAVINHHIVLLSQSKCTKLLGIIFLGKKKNGENDGCLNLMRPVHARRVFWHCVSFTSLEELWKQLLLLAFYKNIHIYIYKYMKSCNANAANNWRLDRYDNQTQWASQVLILGMPAGAF